MEITPSEAKTIDECLVVMQGFSCQNTEINSPFRFFDKPIRKMYSEIIESEDPPSVMYSAMECIPNVHAVVKLYGVMFTQGRK